MKSGLCLDPSLHKIVHHETDLNDLTAILLDVSRSFLVYECFLYLKINSPKLMGGFGGCTINLVRAERYDDFIATAKRRFAEKYGHEPKVYQVVISDGARRL